MLSLRIFKVLFFLGALNVSTTSKIAAASDLTYGEAKSFLDEIVTSDIIGKPSTQAKWITPIYVFIDLKDDILKENIRNQLLYLNQEISGLSIIVSPVETANLKIEAFQEADYFKALKDLNINLQRPSDVCAYRLGVNGQEIGEARIFVKVTQSRQESLHCISRAIMAALGVGDYKKNGLLIADSRLGFFDFLVWKVSSFDLLTIKYLYGSSSHKNDQVTYLKKANYINHYVLEHKEEIKKIESAQSLESKSNFNLIMSNPDKAIAYSYVSKVPYFLEQKAISENFWTSFNPTFLNAVKSTCRNCYYTLLVNLTERAMNRADRSQGEKYAKELIQTYDKAIDTEVIKAAMLFYRAMINFSESSALSDLSEAKIIFEKYNGLRNSKSIFIRHALAHWYFQHGDVQQACETLIENQKFFDGTIIDLITEGQKLMEAAELFYKAKRFIDAKNNIEQARIRFNAVKYDEGLRQLSQIENLVN